MATPLRLRTPDGSSTLRGGDTLRGADDFVVTPATPAEYPTVTLLGVPLAVRLKTTRGDTFVSKDVTSLSFRSVIPGGFASCEIGLNRPLATDPDEVQLYGDVYIYDGRSAKTVWQGRLEDPGRASSAAGEVWKITAVGPSAHAKDRVLPVVYVDQNFDWWRPYNQNTVAGNITIKPASDTGNTGSMIFHCPRGTLAVANGYRLGMQYNAFVETGQKIGRFSYSWDSGVTDADWQIRVRTGPGNLTLVESDIDFNTAGGTDAKVITTDFTNTHYLISMTIERVGANQTPANDDTWGSFGSIVLRGTVYGASGSEDTAGASYSANTILASTVVNDLLGRVLSDFDGANASVTATSYAIDQLAYPDGASAWEILNDLMLFESGYYWGAWEETSTGKNRFEWKAWPTTIRYEANVYDGFDSPGSAAQLFNAVNVRWKDNFGRIRKNTRTQTVAELTAAGITRTAFIDISDVFGSTLNADRVGDQFLSEHSTPPNAGTLKISRPISDRVGGTNSTPGMVHPWEIQPGYLIRVMGVKPRLDALNATTRDAVTIFKIISVDYDAASNTATLELDSQSKALTRLLSPPTFASERRR